MATANRDNAVGGHGDICNHISDCMVQRRITKNVIRAGGRQTKKIKRQTKTGAISTGNGLADYEMQYEMLPSDERMNKLMRKQNVRVK